MSGTTRTANGVTARYLETDTERVLVFEREPDADRQGAGANVVVIAQNREGYAMLKVRTGVEGDELERYYGLDMALDHVGELLGVAPDALPVPETARDMGM